MSDALAAIAIVAFAGWIIAVLAVGLWLLLGKKPGATQ
jgi:hypothetical protein